MNSLPTTSPSAFGVSRNVIVGPASATAVCSRGAVMLGRRPAHRPSECCWPLNTGGPYLLFAAETAGATAETTNPEPIANGVLHDRPPIRSPGAPLRCCQSATDGRAEARHDPVDMRHAAPIKPVRLKASARDQQNEFIQHRCQQLRVCCKTITAERLSPRVKTIRDQILMEVKARWPMLTPDALASCLTGRRTPFAISWRR
ncbi:hypothetical protein Sinme_6412 [Sinorhizobium meliloti AK83]|nr:hypothetical protein Sinme_6412 [Sinorhizobium meliloti AK83]SEJ82874.1 hypothetical protein SAMN04244575_06446 [Sinorhizobium meliloti]